MPGLIGCGVDVRAKDGDGKEHHTTGVICAISLPRGKEPVEFFLMSSSGDFFRAEAISCHVDERDIEGVIMGTRERGEGEHDYQSTNRQENNTRP